MCNKEKKNKKALERDGKEEEVWKIVLLPNNMGSSLHSCPGSPGLSGTAGFIQPPPLLWLEFSVVTTIWALQATAETQLWGSTGVT